MDDGARALISGVPHVFVNSKEVDSSKMDSLFEIIKEEFLE